jgi:hypothetical protein
VGELPAAAAQTVAKSEQDALSAGSISELLILWKLLDPAAVVPSTPDWLRQVLGLIDRWRQRSVDRAVTDYNTVRAIVTGQLVPFQPQLSPAVDVPALTKDLLINGPGTVMQQLKLGKTPDQAMRAGFVTTSGVVNKAVLDGGRQTTLAAIAQDPQARFGATRIARPDACGFCKMLQANTYSKAHVGFAAHDLCRCVAGPVFRIGQPVPAAQRAAQELWATSTKGLFGKEALSAFRAAADGRVWSGYKGKGNPKARKSKDATPAAAVPEKDALRKQYSAEHAALSKTVGSTKTSAARTYQTDRIAQLERMLALL